MSLNIYLKRRFTFLRNFRISKIVFLFKHIDKILSIYSMNLKINKSDTKKGKDLFILSSCINPNDNSTYINYKQPLSAAERLYQVLDSVNSVRSHFPESRIVYLDNSNISSDLEKELISVIDDYYNYSQCEIMSEIRKIHNKGIAWSLTNLLFLLNNFNNYEYETIHFLNGRYCVSKKVVENKNLLNSNKNLYLKFKKYNVSTIYFMFYNESKNNVINYFKKAFYYSMMGFSVEDVFAISSMKAYYLKELGVFGKINGHINNYE
jgi:hypothetical protein